MKLSEEWRLAQFIVIPRSNRKKIRIMNIQKVTTIAHIPMSYVISIANEGRSITTPNFVIRLYKPSPFGEGAGV